MADDEKDYLRKCLNDEICPKCQKPLVDRIGSGQFKDGVFCSLSCYGEWHEAALKRRHQERMRKENPDG